MTVDFNAIFELCYPMHKPRNRGEDPCRNGRLGKLQLKCNSCGDLISKMSHRKWGNPLCGGCYRGAADILELTYESKPLFTGLT